MENLVLGDYKMSDMAGRRANIMALLSQFKSIYRSVNELLRQEIRVVIGPFILQRIKGVIRSYEEARARFARLAVPEAPTLAYIEEAEAGKFPIRLLERMKHECEMAITFLESLLYELTPDEVDKLNSLRNELNSIKALDPGIHLHLENALMEYENRHYLSVTILSGKVIVYVLEQIRGKSYEEKLKELKSRNILPEYLEVDFLNAAKRARNYYTHNIDTSPAASDALDMLARSFQFANMLKKYRESIEFSQKDENRGNHREN